MLTSIFNYIVYNEKVNMSLVHIKLMSRCLRTINRIDKGLLSLFVNTVINSKYNLNMGITSFLH